MDKSVSFYQIDIDAFKGGFSAFIRYPYKLSCAGVAREFWRFAVVSMRSIVFPVRARARIAYISTKKRGRI